MNRAIRASRVITFAAVVAFAGCTTSALAPATATAPTGAPSLSVDPTPPPVGEGGLTLAPLPPDPAFVAAARAECLKGMVADPAVPLVVQDQRRPDLAALYFEGPTEYVLQLVERRQDGTFGCPEGSGGDLPLMSGVRLAITQWGPFSDRGLEGLLIAGYVDPSATEVRVRRANGIEVRASVGGGRFIAFWIGSPEIVALAAYDSSGREIARVDDPIELGGGIP